MNVLLVEPEYRRITYKMRKLLSGEFGISKCIDESLWYPPLGLMKLSTFHKNRGDNVEFICGCRKNILNIENNVSNEKVWDRIYITTLFTYNWDVVIRTIQFYKNVVDGKIDKIFVGGVMASLMANDIYKETNIKPIKGVLNSPSQIGLKGDVDIDLLPPDYALANLNANLYAINDTYYAYTSRGCVNKCGWCGVPIIEPKYIKYINIKDAIIKARKLYGDKKTLKLMDNNVLASPDLAKIVDDLIDLGYGKNEFPDLNKNKKELVIDFNQGLDASYLNHEVMQLISKLNIKPMRIAFDSIKEKDIYINAVKLAKDYGFKLFSNYMLFNWNDSPKDLYERILINIKLNEDLHKERKGNETIGQIFCYPMRYAPINEKDKIHGNRERDFVRQMALNKKNDFLNNANWTKRFVRNIEIMKGAAHGAISSTPSLALRTVGSSYEEFIANLYMPEEFLRNRNKYEKKVHTKEPNRKPGTGDIEKFRRFIIRLIKKGDKRFLLFHEIVSENRKRIVREAMDTCKDKIILRWLKYYLM